MSGTPHVRVPTAEHHIELTDEEVEDFRSLADGLLEEYERLDLLSEPTLRAPYTDRDPGYRPEGDEDPLNAFVTRCRVEGADDGPLSGYDVGVKDTVSVAGVAMTNGSKLMAHYTVGCNYPNGFDSTVHRIRSGAYSRQYTSRRSTRRS